MIRTISSLTLAWVPFFLLWTLFAITSEAPLAQALLAGTSAIGTAAVLGIGVWWLTDRLPWPERIGFGFCMRHGLAGGLYAIGWLVGGDIVMSWLSGDPMEDYRFWTWSNAGWRIMMGLWLYGLVAGVSYALRISGRLRAQQQASARLEALATHARLKSLRARLNPHFLFNALNSVAALIPHQPQLAERSVERLGDLLRYSLAESEGLVSFEQEWAFVSDYLEMEQLRFGERLIVESSFGARTHQALLPPFTLQALVENAVRHGAAPRTDPTTVSVRATINDTHLIVEVRDDGCGASTKGIEESSGTGIRDLKERLSGLYGPAASVVHTAYEVGVQVTVLIPQIRRWEEGSADDNPTDEAPA